MKILSLHRAGAAMLIASIVLWSSSAASAGGAGSSGGLTLLEAAGARAAGLGEAMSAVGDDVTAAVYNPAALATLTSPQVSFSYLKGIADDASGRLHLGRPDMGVAVSYYNAGKVDLLDGSGTRSVNAETDLAATFGVATQRGDNQWGAAVKYLSSQLAETDRARAFALDLGVRRQLGSRLVIGSALQNFGTQLKFVNEGDPLPRLLRVGAAFQATHGRAPLLLNAEAPYLFNEKELRPAFGAEIHVGPLAFRAGYRTGSSVDGLSVGAGFATGGLLIDYSFGFVQDLTNRQRISLGFKFGKAAEKDVQAPLAVPMAIAKAAPTEAGTAVNAPVALFRDGGSR